MSFNTITLDRSPKSKLLVLKYTSTTKDTTGMGGTWEGAGHYADVWEVDGHYVLVANTIRVIGVYHSIKEMMEDIGKKTRAQMIYKV